MCRPTPHPSSIADVRSGGCTVRCLVYGGIPCTVTSNASWLMGTWDPSPVNRQTWQLPNPCVLNVNGPLKCPQRCSPFRETMRSYGVTRLSLIDTSREDVRIRGTEPCSPRVTTVNKYDSLGGDVCCFSCRRTFLYLMSIWCDEIISWFF